MPSDLKTTLAARLAGALGAGPARPAVRVLALEALVPGWSALARGAGRAAAVLRDLRHGRAGVAPSWDWEAMRAGDPVRVDPLDGGILVLEEPYSAGIGCGGHYKLVTTLLTTKCGPIVLTANNPDYKIKAFGGNKAAGIGTGLGGKV